MEPNKTREEKFYKWLSGRVSAKQLSESYVIFNTISKHYQQSGYLTSNIFEVTDIDTLNRVLKNISTGKTFKRRYPGKQVFARLGMMYYIKYIEEEGVIKDTKLEENSINCQEKDGLIPSGEPKSNMNAQSQKEIVKSMTDPSFSSMKSCEESNAVRSSKIEKEEGATGDSITQRLYNEGIQFVDNRDKGGKLWINQSGTADELIQEFRMLGLKFGYSSVIRAWWTLDTFYEEVESKEDSLQEKRLNESEKSVENKSTDSDNKQVTVDVLNKDNDIGTKRDRGRVVVGKKPWDKFEAAILLAATIQIYEGTITRQRAITYVSKALRGKAQQEGFVIGEIFRNEAGITFQMYSMEAAYLGHTVRNKTATKLFLEVENIRKNDKSQYESLLAKAKEKVIDVDKSSEYQNWVLNLGQEKAKSIIVSNPSERQSTTTDTVISSDGKDVGASHATQNKQSNKKVPEQPFNTQTKYTVNFAGKNDYSYTRPLSFSYFGDTTSVSSWRQVYVKICQLLLRDHPADFKTFRDRNGVGAYNLIFSKSASFTLTSPVQIGDGYFIEANRSSTSLVRNLKVLFDWCNVDYRRIKVFYQKTQELNDDSTSSSYQETLTGSNDDSETQTDKEKTISVRCTVQTGREEFAKWLKDNSLRNSAQYTTWTLSKISDLSIKQGITSDSLYTICDANELMNIAEKLDKNGTYKEFKRWNNSAESVLKQYIDFRLKWQSSVPHQLSKTYKKADKPESFNELTKDTRNRFMEYMGNQGYSDSTVRGMASAVATVGEYAKTHGLFKQSPYMITDPESIEKYWKKIKSDTGFSKYNTGQNRRFSVAMKHYIAFINGYRSKKVICAKDQIEQKVVGFAARPSIHPGSIEFESWLKEKKCPSGSIRTYLQSVSTISEYLLKEGLEERDIFAIRGIARLERILDILKDDQGYTLLVGTDKVDLDIYAFKKYIAFRSNDSSESIDKSTKKRFETILHSHFENGYRVNSMIDRNRFKQYYEDTYGDEVSEEDDELVSILKQIGSEQDNRIYWKDSSSHNDLIDDIQSEIARTFNLGISCVYYSELFARYQERLAMELNVYSMDVLKSLLVSSSYDAYCAAKHYFYQKDRLPNASLDVERLMRQSNVPLSYNEIYGKLRFIPLDTIKHSLVVTDKVVNVAQETYFYAPNLPINAEELNQIASLIKGQLQQKTFITDVELRELIEKYCPSVAINTEDYQTWGLRNALAVLLGDRFSFKGAIISERGEELNMAQAFSEFCHSYETLTVEELKQFAKSMNTVVYWDSVYDEMIRVSQNEFVSKEQVQFDIQAIDAVIDELMNGDYQSLQSFTLFLHFPVINVQWNTFVLESFVAKYSRKFSLMHASYTATDCCGAVVRKNSDIKDFNGLITDVLSNSNRWKTKNDALALLVAKGYLQRKRYSGIEAVIVNAKIRRDS